MEDKELDELLENSVYAKKAMELFKEGYNCAQAVFLAFTDRYEMDETIALKLSSSFGGGMGRLREVCGAVSGMFMVAGVLYGYESPEAFEEKTKHYERIQQLAEQYKKFTGSIICRELLGLDVKKDSHVPEKRTNEYYNKRPCVKMVGIGAMLMEKYIINNEVTNKID